MVGRSRMWGVSLLRNRGVLDVDTRLPDAWGVADSVDASPGVPRSVRTVRRCSGIFSGRLTITSSDRSFQKQQKVGSARFLGGGAWDLGRRRASPVGGPLRWGPADASVIQPTVVILGMNRPVPSM